MFELEKLIRPNIRQLQAYASARSTYQGKATIFLDANENPYGELNRYPDPQQQALKDKLAAGKGLASKNIFIGNGSDEVVDLALRIFCTPGRDQALRFTPTYGMYQVSAAIQDVALIDLPLTAGFQIDVAALAPYFQEEKLKLIFICSPNNPTGNLLDREAIRYILKRFSGIVVIDEAYIDFSDEASWTDVLTEYPNLIVSQTLSKAWGLAGARIGIAYASEAIIALFNRIKPPYNVGSLNQEAALRVLDQEAAFWERRSIILAEKEKLKKALNRLSIVKKVYPSEANFLLVEFSQATECYQALLAQGIVIRNRHHLVPNCLRITVGSPAENEKLLQCLQTAIAL